MSTACRPVWTKEEDEFLKTEVVNGCMGVATASDRLNRVRADTMQRARQFGWVPVRGSRPNRDPILTERVLTAKREGLMAREIAARLDTSIHIVNRICSENGMGRFSTRRWSDEDKAVLEGMVRNGASSREATEKLRRSWESIKRMLSVLYPGTKPLHVRHFLYERESRLDRLIRVKIRMATKRSRDWGRVIDINDTWVKETLAAQRYRCHYTGIEFNATESNGSTFSIERVDSALGYTRDNCVLVLSDVNRMKMELSMSRFVHLCEQVVNHAKAPQEPPHAGDPCQQAVDPT